VRKAQERRPGYHPKATVPGVTPPAVPASPTPTAPAN
jgi:hypothetical protein